MVVKKYLKLKRDLTKQKTTLKCHGILLKSRKK